MLNNDDDVTQKQKEIRSDGGEPEDDQNQEEGRDHTRPTDVFEERRAETEEVTREDVERRINSLSTNTDEWEGTREEHEVDMQWKRIEYENDISDQAQDLADDIGAARDYSQNDLEHTWDFNPSRGDYSFEGLEGQEGVEGLGLKNFVSRLSDQMVGHDGNYTLNKNKISKANDELEEAREKLDEKEEAIRNQEEYSSNPANPQIGDGEDDDEVADAELEAAKRELESLEEDLMSDIQTYGERKRAAQDKFDEAAGAVTDAYQEAADEVSEFVTEATEELAYMTDWLEELASEDIRELEKVVKERVPNAEGKILDDGEGAAREFYREAVNGLATRATMQYAQIDKALQELEAVEEGMADKYFEDLKRSEELREEVYDEVSEGTPYEEHLDSVMQEGLETDYQARDEIRNTFRALEALRDEE